MQDMPTSDEMGTKVLTRPVYSLCPWGKFCLKALCSLLKFWHVDVSDHTLLGIIMVLVIELH